MRDQVVQLSLGNAQAPRFVVHFCVVKLCHRNSVHTVSVPHELRVHDVVLVPV